MRHCGGTGRVLPRLSERPSKELGPGFGGEDLLRCGRDLTLRPSAMGGENIYKKYFLKCE